MGPDATNLVFWILKFKLVFSKYLLHLKFISKTIWQSRFEDVKMGEDVKIKWVKFVCSINSKKGVIKANHIQWNEEYHIILIQDTIYSEKP